MKTLARAVGVLCPLALIVIGIYVGAARLRSYPPAPTATPTPTPTPEREFHFTGRAEGLEDRPALALEFADKEGEVQQYLDQPGIRQKVRDGLAMDNVFIAAYWLLFAGLCVLLAGRGFKRRVWRFEWPYGLWLAVFAAVCATGAAVTDTVENAHIATLLDATALTQQLTKMLGTAEVPEVMKQLAAGVPGGTMRLVMNVAEASFQKWTLIALATLALWPVFLWRGGWPARLFGAGLCLIYLAAGALMLWGALGGLPRFVVAGFKTLIAGSGVITFVFTLKPEWVAGVSKDAAEETQPATR